MIFKRILSLFSVNSLDRVSNKLDTFKFPQDSSEVIKSYKTLLSLCDELSNCISSKSTSSNSYATIYSKLEIIASELNLKTSLIFSEVLNLEDLLFTKHTVEALQAETSLKLKSIKKS